MHADEFSLILTWAPSVNRVASPVPGFYARASFANEGEAQAVIKGTWTNGVGGNGSLVSASFIYGLVQLLDDHGLLEPGITASLLAKQLADASTTAQSRALSAKRDRLERLRDEVAQLEAEVG